MQKDITSIDSFIHTFPPSVQEKLEEIRQLVHQLAPTATEAISYGIPTFKLNGNLIHFSAYKTHLGFYPGAEAIKVFQDELKDFETSKALYSFHWISHCHLNS